MDPITARLKPLDGGRILDVATGFGEFLKILTDSFGSYAEAIGIDFSHRVTDDDAIIDDPGFELKVMDAEHIEYADGYFDTVAVRNSLHHFANRDTVLAEMKRVLKPGGLLIVCEVIQAKETEKPNSQRHLHHWWSEVDQVFGTPHFHTFTRDQVLAIIAEAGWETTDTFDYREELTDEDLREELESMLKHSEDLIEKLTNKADRPDLVKRGHELVERFGKLGVVTESMVYLLARN